MTSYIPNPEDSTEPKDSKGVGSAAAEFRALKLYIATMQARLTTMETSQAAFIAATNASIDAIEAAAASFLGGDIGQISPFMRLGSVGDDLANHLYCDGRYFGRMRTEADGTILPQPEISDSTDKYFDLYEVMWNFLKYAANLWSSLYPSLAASACPVTCAEWAPGGFTRKSFKTVMTDLGGDPTATAGWATGNYALFLPDLRGRSIRGANPYDGVNSIPKPWNPTTVFQRQPDYGRVPATYQAASLLTGDDNNGTARIANIANVGATQADSESDPVTLAGVREALGWDKVGADTSNSGTPYADPRSATGKLRLRLAKTTSGATYNDVPDVGTPLNDFYSKYFGAARVDNFSLPYFIRYR